MKVAAVLEKFESLKQQEGVAIFGYRYYHSKLADYVSLANLRLELLQIGKGKVLYTLAAPVMEVSRGSCSIKYDDCDLVVPQNSDRAGIVIRNRYLRDGEDAAPVANCGTWELTEDSDERLLYRAADMAGKPAYPGTDMREPPYYRCSKNPSRIRLNYNADLLAALGLAPTVRAQELKEAFLNKLSQVASPTDEGWVVPFNWVYAGGMVVVPANDMGKKCPKVLYRRSTDFVRNFAAAKGWNLTCV